MTFDYREWRDERYEDALFTDHENGHPDGPPNSYRYCTSEKDPWLSGVDQELPQLDIPPNVVRKELDL